MASSVTNCLMILVAAGILTLSLAKNTRVSEALRLVRPGQQADLKRYLSVHQGLMIFFLIAYLLEIVAIASGLTWVSESFVSLIFLLGALYVFIGIDLKVRLLGEVQSTLHGILPICAKCKKIRVERDCQEEETAWEEIECYISEKVAVSFSHGYCPACYEAELRQIKALCHGQDRSDRG